MAVLPAEDGVLSGVSTAKMYDFKANDNPSKGATQPSEDLPTSGVLTSPNYPNEYPNSLQFTRTIRVPKGNIIAIQFTG